MKVRISFTVDIDVDAWMMNYGVESGDVRKDVQVYVENGTRDHLGSLGLLSVPGDQD